MHVVLDSGVSNVKNMGDLFLLDITRLLFGDVRFTVLFADCFNIVFSIMRCDLYYFVAGGLLKDCAEKRLMLRKLFAVFLARIFMKPIYVDSQTVFLHGFYRALFKFVFLGLPFRVRDKYSLRDCWDLGLTTVLKGSQCFNKKDFGRNFFIAVDGRFKYLDSEVRSEFCKVVSQVSKFFDVPVLVVPTIFTDVDWREIEYLFGSALFAVTCSYHASEFCYCHGVDYIFVNGGKFKDYANRKVSVLC